MSKAQTLIIQTWSALQALQLTNFVSFGKICPLKSTQSFLGCSRPRCEDLMRQCRYSLSTQWQLNKLSLSISSHYCLVHTWKEAVRHFSAHVTEEETETQRSSGPQALTPSSAFPTRLVIPGFGLVHFVMEKQTLQEPVFVEQGSSLSLKGPTKRLMSLFAHQHLWPAGKEETLLPGISFISSMMLRAKTQATVGWNTFSSVTLLVPLGESAEALPTRNPWLNSCHPLSFICRAAQSILAPGTSLHAASGMFECYVTPGSYGRALWIKMLETCLKRQGDLDSQKPISGSAAHSSLTDHCNQSSN